ncbi:hypothetical protein [Candidatus Nitrosocosmicus hydrocola]|uniref:hypothetical protein n=1 Tax=Candidatus Nitrosocosmicus hydrocola TaxID=1826872 RepID=UPI001372C60D|nr:hypothetical protein [Candidatus Nitrosocosmicus hydrocola]
MKDSRCIICGKTCNMGFDHSGNLKFNIDKASCYLIYKKLLGVYGIQYMRVLNSHY